MARNPSAGHQGAVGAKHRCSYCEHRPRRVVSATVQTEGKPVTNQVPRVRKKPCDCNCHTAPGARGGARRPAPALKTEGDGCGG